MGPENPEKAMKMRPVAEVRHAIVKATKTYSENPVGSLWSFMIWLTIFGLFFGVDLPWQYYTILISLTGVLVFRYFHERSKHSNT